MMLADLRYRGVLIARHHMGAIVAASSLFPYLTPPAFTTGPV
jgi:hypothetical protein